MERKYRPSNGSEAEIFMTEHCAKCLLYDKCQIPNNAFWNDIDEPEYPPQWIYSEREPICTDFTNMEILNEPSK